MNPRTLVRREVRQLLEATPAWRRLGPEDRRAMARGLVRIGSFLADPAWLDDSPPYAPRELLKLRARLTAPRAVGLAQGTGAQFHQGATRDAGESFGTLAGSVDFPAFVASLIKGVFRAIVDSSIQQMEAYQQLVNNLVQSLTQFERNVSDSDASGFLSNQFPGTFSMDSGALMVRSGVSRDPDLSRQLGLASDFDFGGANTQVLVQAGRRKMAQQRQQMLATMALMGINRIVVTDGRVNAKVLFDMQATDTAKLTQKASYERTDSKHTQHSSKSFWGTSHSSSSEDIRTTVRSSSQADSESQLKLHASLSGEVGVNFKSETVDLNKLVADKDLEKIKHTATPQPLSGE